jgi:hypothetical protein
MTAEWTNESTEWQALVHLCALGLSLRPATNLESIDLNKVDWDTFLRLAQFHRVKPLVHHGLTQSDFKVAIPQNIITNLKEAHYHRLLVNMDHTKEMLQIIRLLEERGVKVIPYKGVILAEEAYNNLGLREMSDIDLLINLKDFEIIKDVFLQRNYVPSKHINSNFEGTFFKQNFEYNFDLFREGKRIYHVEPHWKIGFTRWQTDLEFDDIFQLTRKAKFFKESIDLLTPEGLLITTCLHHGGEDRWNSLKYVCDVAALLRKFEKEIDWEFLIKKTEEFKVTNLILLGIDLAVHIFSVSIPEEIQKKISSRKIRKHTLKIYSQLPQVAHSQNISSYLSDLKFHFLLRKNLSTKLKVLYYHLVQIFQPTNYDVNDEGNADKKYWQLFITKPFRIWRQHVKRNRT